MKLRIKFKDPDLIHAYLCDQVPSPKKATEAQDDRVDRMRTKLCDKLFEFGDYGCVELDTETGTGRFVHPSKR